MNSPERNDLTDKYERPRRPKPKLTAAELVIFAMLGALMYVTKTVMAALPNIHLVGVFTVTFTRVFRTKALIPIYLYVMLEGIFQGFSPWWIPYLYIWTLLWGITMLLPKNMPDKAAYIVCPIVCAIHGLAFGTLYAPAYAVLFHLDFPQTLAWIAAGFPWDLIHAVSNLVLGTAIVPLAKLLDKLMKRGDAGLYQ